MSATVVVGGPIVPSGTVYVFNRAVTRSNRQHNPYIDRLCETWLSFVERLECHADAPFLTDLLQNPLEVDAIGQMGTASRVYCLLQSVLEPLARRILVLLSVLDDRHGIACMLNVSRALSVGSLVLEHPPPLPFVRAHVERACMHPLMCYVYRYLTAAIHRGPGWRILLPTGECPLASGVFQPVEPVSDHRHPTRGLHRHRW